MIPIMNATKSKGILKLKNSNQHKEQFLHDFVLFRFQTSVRVLSCLGNLGILSVGLDRFANKRDCCWRVTNDPGYLICQKFDSKRQNLVEFRDLMRGIFTSVLS